MADPLAVPCPEGAWTKVATAVTSGMIFKRINAIYVQTYRVTGGAAPTDETDSGPIFTKSDNAEIGANAAIDVYIKAKNKAGEVRVDL